MENKKILGIDYGDFTIGLAIFDANVRFTYPYKTLQRKKANVIRKSLREIADIVIKEKITDVVIGYPININGTEGERVEIVKCFAKMLEQRLDKNIKIFFQDERFSTKEANDILSEHGVKNVDKKRIIDQVAATIILNDFVKGKE